MCTPPYLIKYMQDTKHPWQQYQSLVCSCIQSNLQSLSLMQQWCLLFLDRQSETEHCFQASRSQRSGGVQQQKRATDPNQKVVILLPTFTSRHVVVLTTQLLIQLGGPKLSLVEEGASASAKAAAAAAPTEERRRLTAVPQRRLLKICLTQSEGPFLVLVKAAEGRNMVKKNCK